MRYLIFAMIMLVSSPAWAGCPSINGRYILTMDSSFRSMVCKARIRNKRLSAQCPNGDIEGDLTVRRCQVSGELLQDNVRIFVFTGLVGKQVIIGNVVGPDGWRFDRR